MKRQTAPEGAALRGEYTESCAPRCAARGVRSMTLKKENPSGGSPESAGFGEDNETLLRRIAQGDEAALDLLVRKNLGLVRSTAMHFRDRSYPGCEFEDLLQLGTIGMIKAARSFDFSYGTVFSTYAVPLIAGEIRRFLRDDGPVKVSRSIRQAGAAVMRARDRFLREEGREPRLSELAALCGLTPEEVTDAMEAALPVRSLSEPVGGEEGNGSALEDFLPDGDPMLDTLTDSIALREAIGRLSEQQQQQILQLRYYREMSQQQTGKILGLSQVKISREEKKIMQLLRSAL